MTDDQLLAVAVSTASVHYQCIPVLKEVGSHVVTTDSIQDHYFTVDFFFFLAPLFHINVHTQQHPK